jgi:hypothetical protein
MAARGKIRKRGPYNDVGNALPPKARAANDNRPFSRKRVWLIVILSGATSFILAHAFLKWMNL